MQEKANAGSCRFYAYNTAYENWNKTQEKTTLPRVAEFLAQYIFGKHCVGQMMWKQNDRIMVCETLYYYILGSEGNLSTLSGQELFMSTQKLRKYKLGPWGAEWRPKVPVPENQDGRDGLQN